MSKEKKIKAVIFDLDDTLLSEYEFVVSGYKYVSVFLSRMIGVSAEEINERLWELSKDTYANAFNRLFDSYGIAYTKNEVISLVDAYRNHPANLTFYPDVYPTLNALKEKGILTDIISDGDPQRQWNKINFAVAAMQSDNRSENDGQELASPDKWFDAIILNDEFGGERFRKPNPHGFKVIAGKLGIDPSEMIYVGDNPAKDFHISADLPVRTARIIREHGIYNDKEYLDGIKETYGITALTDILDII
ncbi:MAG: HAD hydrolase-like protein [Lachnospiraceae bacterium]|nr:HAD hydrolase-like protein [Lachnospiraceae bacterium]